MCLPGLSLEKMTSSVAQLFLYDMKQFVAACCAGKVYSKYITLRIVLSKTQVSNRGTYDPYVPCYVIILFCKVISCGQSFG